MRRRAPLLLSAVVALAACTAAPAGRARGAAGRPVRVMSVNQCTDQLVLALLPLERIASVTWLSRNPASSLMAREAARVPVNHGLAEEVVAAQPDLVIAGSFATPALRAMLKRVGYPLVEVPDAASFADVRRITRQVAAAVGESARGEALIADMDRKLALLAHDATPPVPVVAWDRTGFSAGPGTLYDAVLGVAGARNLAGSPTATAYRSPDIEVLLKTDPALIVQGSGDAGADLGADVAQHRLVRRYWAGRTLAIPQALYLCGAPRIVDGAIALRARLRAAAARTGTTGPLDRAS